MLSNLCLIICCWSAGLHAVCRFKLAACLHGAAHTCILSGRWAQEDAGGLPGHVLQQLSSVPVPGLDTNAPSIFDRIMIHNVEGMLTGLIEQCGSVSACMAPCHRLCSAVQVADVMEPAT